jgi:outer membrane protein
MYAPPFGEEMKIQRIPAALAAILTLSAGAHAQQAQPVERITFQQAVTLALRQNVSVLQAENAIETSRLTVSQARSSMWPTFSFNVGGSSNIGKQFDPNTLSLVTKQTQSANTGVSSSFTLIDFGRGLDVASARSSLSASEANLYRGRQTAVYTVATQFVAYLGAKSQLDVQKENLASLQLQESQVQRFADAGARPISDLYNVKAQVANTQLAVVRAEQNIENAKFALMRTLQLDPAKDYDFVKPDVTQAQVTAAYNLDSLTAIAYRQRRDYVAAQQTLDAARYQVRSDARGHWPSIGVNAGYNTSGRFGQTLPIGDQFEQNRGGSVSLGVSLPVLDRGQTRIARTRSAIAEENAQLQLAATKQNVALDVRTAWYNIRAAQQQLLAAQAGLIAATQALEATQQRYNVGAATLLEVSTARATRVNAQSNLADAEYNLVVNQAAMAYFTGELDPVTMTIGR